MKNCLKDWSQSNKSPVKVAFLESLVHVNCLKDIEDFILGKTCINIETGSSPLNIFSSMCLFIYLELVLRWLLCSLVALF